MFLIGRHVIITKSNVKSNNYWSGSNTQDLDSEQDFNISFRQLSPSQLAAANRLRLRCCLDQHFDWSNELIRKS